MINFDEFIKRWSGKPIDFDGIYPDQCMDLMHFYIYEVLGVTDKTVLAAPAASEVYTKFKPAWWGLFEKIDNTDTNMPLKGDLVFWGSKIGPYGHVAIYVEGDVNRFSSFDANWPTGTKPHLQEHSYLGVLGWLRLQPEVVVPTGPPPVVTNPDQVKVHIGVNLKTSHDYGDPEVGAIRSMLFDGENKRDDLANQLSLCINGQLHPLSLANIPLNDLFSEVVKRLLGR